MSERLFPGRKFPGGLVWRYGVALILVALVAKAASLVYGLFVLTVVLLWGIIEVLRWNQQKGETAARELAEVEQRYRRLLDTAQEGIWMLDVAGRTQYVNRRMTELLGYPAENMRDRGFWEFLTPEEQHVAQRDWGRGRMGAREQPEVCFLRQGGGKLWAKVAINPSHDVEGNLRGALAVVTDITSKKQADEKARFIADASQVLASSLDYEGTIQSVARLAVPALGDWCAVDMLSADGTVARLAIVHADPAGEARSWEVSRRFPTRTEDDTDIMRVLRSGKPVFQPEVGDEVLQRNARDAEHLEILRGMGIVSCMIVPLRARGRTLGAITLLTTNSGRRYVPSDLPLAEALARRATLAVDNSLLYREAQKEIAERKQIEGALRESEERLRSAVAELHRANQAKDEFLAMLAHELRNPLAPLFNALHLMAIHPDNADKIATARMLAERQVRHMTRLVEDLLDVSRITRGKIELRKQVVILDSIVANAIQSSRPLIDARRQQLTVSVPSEPIALEADATRLDQILSNLLNNAAKYTDETGRIELIVERSDGEVIIHVRDNGVGIPAEVLPRVFDLFVQATPSLDRAQGGLGIGLTLVRSLVELHGGSVQALSAGPGQGSEFVVRLPILAEVPEQGERPVQPAPAEAPSTRVLIVDDNVDAAQSLAMLLEACGHAVQIAHDGPGALESAPSFHPQVVLLDIGLPHMDGYEVARQLRQQMGTEIEMLVALTGYGGQEDRRRSREAGFDRHLVKPFDPAELERLLSERNGGARNQLPA
jgi:PAS domain S-box-containing protein